MLYTYQADAYRQGFLFDAGCFGIYDNVKRDSDVDVLGGRDEQLDGVGDMLPKRSKTEQQIRASLESSRAAVPYFISRRPLQLCCSPGRNHGHRLDLYVCPERQRSNADTRSCGRRGRHHGEVGRVHFCEFRVVCDLRGEGGVGGLEERWLVGTYKDCEFDGVCET